MATQKAMGRHQLVSRLAAQTGSKGMAIAILKKRGQMSDEGKLTAAGKKRDSMTAAARAKDRAAQSSGRPAKAYSYNPRTNSAHLKGRKNP